MDPPQPFEIRAALPFSFSISSGFFRSVLVIELMIDSTRISCLSSTFMPSGSPPPKNGIFSKRSVSGPIERIVRICSTKSIISNSPASIFLAFFSASSSSTTFSKSCIKPTMSPKPMIRLARPSGLKSSSASSPSPIPKNLMGLPVTDLIESAAPPRASPSSLVIINPLMPISSSKVLAVSTAS